MMVMRISLMVMDDDLPIMKLLELRNMEVAVRSIFYEDRKYYLQGF